MDPESGEVRTMEEIEKTPDQEKPGYVPRPWWQVWGARVLLVIFLAVLAVFYLIMFRGKG